MPMEQVPRANGEGDKGGNKPGTNFICRVTGEEEKHTQPTAAGMTKYTGSQGPK